MTDRQLWEQALAELRMQMTKTTWHKWFYRSTAQYQKEDDVLIIDVHLEYQLDRLRCKWTQPVKRLVSGILGREINVEFVHRRQ